MSHEVRGVSDAEKEFEVTPWEVKGKVDYAKLIEQFGTKLITNELLDRLQNLIKKPLHFMLRRRLFFSHRDFDWLLGLYEQGTEFALYTGRGPSGNTHFGHLVPWIFTKWLQDVFDVELYFQITDDEKFLYKHELDYDTTMQYGLENAKDVLALGFNPKKTFFIIDSQTGPTFRRIATEVAKRITFSMAKATFGFTESTNIGLIFHPAIQAAPCFYPSVLKKQKIPVLIPAAIDQDPYWRITRDVAPRLGYHKPAAIHCQFLPGLKESGDGKMSASDPDSAIYTTDDREAVKRKVWRAFTGGRTTVKEQRELGGIPEICTVLKYLEMVFEEDEQALKQRELDCKQGNILCGECKNYLTEKVVKFLENHQRQRKSAERYLEECILRE